MPHLPLIFVLVQMRGRSAQTGEDDGSHNGDRCVHAIECTRRCECDVVVVVRAVEDYVQEDSSGEHAVKNFRMRQSYQACEIPHSMALFLADVLSLQFLDRYVP